MMGWVGVAGARYEANKGGNVGGRHGANRSGWLKYLVSRGWKIIPTANYFSCGFFSYFFSSDLKSAFHSAFLILLRK